MKTSKVSLLFIFVALAVITSDCTSSYSKEEEEAFKKYSVSFITQKI